MFTFENQHLVEHLAAQLALQAHENAQATLLGFPVQLHFPEHPLKIFSRLKFLVDYKIFSRLQILVD